MRKKDKGIGIDILEIQRIRDAYDRYGERFLEKIFTLEEIAYCNEHKDPFPRFAARFCAKEATAKALGCGIGKELGFKDIRIRNAATGKPQVSLSVRAERIFKKPHFELSLSHCRNYATAIVIIR